VRVLEPKQGTSFAQKILEGLFRQLHLEHFDGHSAMVVEVISTIDFSKGSCS
jgi:hypothetical protein